MTQENDDMVKSYTFYNCTCEYIKLMKCGKTTNETTIR